MSIIHAFRTRRARRGQMLGRINAECCKLDALLPSPLDMADKLATATDYAFTPEATQRLLALIHEDAEWARWHADVARRVEEELWMY